MHWWKPIEYSSGYWLSAHTSNEAPQEWYDTKPTAAAFGGQCRALVTLCISRPNRKCIMVDMAISKYGLVDSIISVKGSRTCIETNLSSDYIQFAKTQLFAFFHYSRFLLPRDFLSEYWSLDFLCVGCCVFLYENAWPKLDTKASTLHFITIRIWLPTIHCFAANVYKGRMYDFFSALTSLWNGFQWIKLLAFDLRTSVQMIAEALSQMREHGLSFGGIPPFGLCICSSRHFRSMR